VDCHPELRVGSAADRTNWVLCHCYEGVNPRTCCYFPLANPNNLRQTPKLV
jgi:hypothetical protein